VDGPVSGFEDLDPAPPGNRALRWETALGALGIAALILFGLWEWRSESARAGAYHAGVAAKAARHWEAARAAFSEAAGYNDAADQVRMAAQQVARLTAADQRAAAAESRGDVLAAWSAAREVAAIQPDYGDIATRLPRLRSQVFTGGVAGIIYLERGPAGGLHLLGGAGDNATLSGSDGASRVVAMAPDGRRFIYDLPASGASGRRLALAAIADGTGATTALLPAQFDPGAPCWFAGDSVWGLDRTRRLVRYAPRAGTPLASALLPAGAVVVGGLPSGALLVAQTSPGVGGEMQTTFSVRSAAGAIPAGAAPGFYLMSTLSADGRYAAALTEETRFGITRTLSLIDLGHPEAPARTVDQIAWTGVILAARLRPSFGPDDSLVVERQDAQGTSVWRYSLPSGAPQPIWSGADPVQRDERAGLSHDGSALAFRAQLDGRAELVWAPVTGSHPPVALPVSELPGQLVDATFAPRDDFVIFTLRNPEGINKGTIEPILAWPAPPTAGSPPILLAQPRRVFDAGLPTVALPAAGALAVFITPASELHARTLDGVEERTLAANVEAVWALPR
jgi:hypothetical protein